SVQSHFRAMPLRPAGSPLIISTHRSGRQGLFVGTGASPRHFRFNIFSGNPCFSNTFFDPLFYQKFIFPDLFSFTQPVLLPYPIITAPYYSVEKEAPPTQVVVVQAAPAAAQAPQPAPESLLLDWRRDHWERVTSYGQPVTSPHPDHSKRSNRRPPSTRN